VQSIWTQMCSSMKNEKLQFMCLISQTVKMTIFYQDFLVFCKLYKWFVAASSIMRGKHLWLNCSGWWLHAYTNLKMSNISKDPIPCYLHRTPLAVYWICGVLQVVYKDLNSELQNKLCKTKYKTLKKYEGYF
jgi:hypothetical protein